jgi:sortase A
MMLAAGAIAWFGLASGGPSPATPAEAVTVPGEARPPRDAAEVPGMSIGGLPTRGVIEAAGVDAPVAEVGVAVREGRPVYETAWRAAGHHLDSALPGQPGNMVITGHVSVADAENLAVFSALESVEAGDFVEVYSGDRAYRYEVEKVMVVPPSAVKLLRSDSTSQVTLVTCTKDLKNRLVVIGTLTV